MTVGTLALILISVILVGIGVFLIWWGNKEFIPPAEMGGIVFIFLVVVMWMSTPQWSVVESKLDEIGSREIFATEVDEEELSSCLDHYSISSTYCPDCGEKLK